MYLHPDLHLHSTASDGSDTPAELLEKIRQTDIDIFALTDHDTYLGCAEVEKNLRPGDPTFLGGIELSCQDDLGKYHILGFCYDVGKPSIREAVEITHNARREKAGNRIKYLEDLGCAFSPEEKAALLANENPGKPHFAALLIAKGVVTDKAQAFALLDGYHGKERRLTPEEAVDAVLQADGIPVLAHGILAEGSKHLTKDQIRERVSRLKGYGLMGLECYYSGYTEEDTQIMLDLAAEFNLTVTAGSDYHGKNKTVPLGASGKPDAARMARFYRVATTLLDK